MNLAQLLSQRVISNDQVNSSQWDKRQDNTKKGYGFLGVMRRPDNGVSSEISIGTNINGKEMEIPTMVPTLDAEEVNYLLNNPTNSSQLFKTPMGRNILQKASQHAQKRLATGNSPFAQEGEQQVIPQNSGYYVNTTPNLHQILLNRLQNRT